MAANHDTDDHLVRRAIAGDAEAFGLLYERYLPAIFRYAFVRLGNAAEAEDVTETTFLKVWESRKRFQPDRISFQSWLYRVAHNLLIDRYRTRRPETSLDDIEIRDPAEAPEGALVAGDENRKLAHAMRRLKPEYQQVLGLRFVAGLSHAETADILHCSPGAARVLQHRALKAMREALARKPMEDA